MNSEILYTQNTGHFGCVYAKKTIVIILLCLKGTSMIKIGLHS